MTHKVLACVDGSAVGTSVCDVSAWASLALEAPLKFLHVIEKSHTPGMDDLSGSLGLGGRDLLLKELSELDARRHIVAIEHGKAILADAASRAEKAGVKPVETSQRHDRLLAALQREQPQTQLFVMGRQGNDHDDSAAAIGTHIENVVRTIHTPILMAVGAFVKPSRFMIAYDGSSSADKALVSLKTGPLAKLLGGLEGHIVMVGNDTADTKAKLAASEAALAASGIEVNSHLLQGKVAEQLVKFQADHDIELTVMGAYGHGRITEFFVGSNTSQMLASSSCPMLILREAP